MELKLACADFTFPLLPHDTALDLIAALGFDGVDVGLFQGRSHLQPSGEFKNIEASAKKLLAKLKDRGLEAADIFLQADTDFVPFAVNHPDPSVRKKVRELFLQALEYTAQVKSMHISILPGVAFASEPRGDSFKRACEELAWRCSAAKDAGIICSVEAHNGSIAQTPIEALELLKNTEGLTLTLDYAHFTKKGIADGEIEALIPYASHFHARGAKEGMMQTPVKESAIDYDRILKRMNQTGYAGYFGIEYVWEEWENNNRVDCISETVILRDKIKKYMAEIRKE